MDIHYVHIWCLPKPKLGIGSSEIGVTDGCKTSCGCWEPNSGPQQE